MSGPQAFENARYFPSLDGLRVLSILPVVRHHCTPRPLNGWLGRGPVGVALFFAVSGFLITMLLLRERLRPGGVRLLSFFSRRSLRLFPLYYLVLGDYTLFAWALPSSLPERRHFFESLPAYASYTTNWFVDFGVSHPVLFAFSWSLATEEQFYLVWGPVLRWMRGRLAPAAFMLGWLAIDHYAEQGGIALPWLSRILASFAAAIGFGALLALLLDHPSARRWVSPWLGSWAAPLVTLPWVLALIVHDGTPPWLLSSSLTLLVGSVALREDHALRPLLANRVFAQVGQVSYGIYLLHGLVIGIVRRLVPGGREAALLVFVVAFPLSWALASLSFRYCETPWLRLRARFRPA